MNLDQKLQLWNAIGTWVAGLATLAAIVVSLWLAVRAQRVQLRAWCGLRLMLTPGKPEQPEYVMVHVTNMGDRPVTISLVGWRIGWRWFKRRSSIQNFRFLESAQYPVEIAHGKEAVFMLPMSETWASEIANKFIQSRSPWYLRTLVAQVHTSVGQTVNCKVEKPLLDALVAHYKEVGK